jgi:hypothetical protein
MVGVASGIVLDVFAYGAILYVFVMGVLAVRFFYEKSTVKALVLYLLPTILGLSILVLLTMTLGGTA